MEKLTISVSIDDFAYIYLKTIKLREKISISEYVNRLILRDIMEKTQLENLEKFNEQYTIVRFINKNLKDKD